jgi:hypothetical protein
MNKLELKRKKINLNDYKRRTALLSDVDKYIDKDTVVYDNGKPIIAYINLKEKTSDLRWAVKNIKYNTGIRTHGLKTQSTIFGYSPRYEQRSDYCTSSALSINEPKQHYVISKFGSNLAKYYEKYFPKKYEQHQKIVKEKVKKDWIIANSPFTSGIVNKNNPLKYHCDSGNFKGVLSNMIVFKKDVSGGHLTIPEYNLALAVDDNSLTIFNGQDLVHGVTPIEYDNKEAYRYSAVYYSLEKMWLCNTIDEELIRIREKKAMREKNRINPEHIKSLYKRKEEATKYKNQIEKQQNTTY